MNNKSKTKELTSSDRARAIVSFYKFGRKYPHFWREIQAHISFSNMFDCIQLFSDHLDFSDIDKVKTWIEIALKDLSAARKLYKAEDGLALYHLQQGIEKIFKATLIYTGFKNETSVVALNHKPQEFVVELLEMPAFNELLGEGFPFKGIKRPKKPTKEEIKIVKNELTSKNKEVALDQGDSHIKFISHLLVTPNPILYNPKKIGDMVLDTLEKLIPPKELRRFSKEIATKDLSFEDIIYYVSNDFFILINMTLILLPLSTGIWAFESVPRYPDEMRLMKKDFQEYELHKAFYLIISHVEKFGEFFLKYVS